MVVSRAYTRHADTHVHAHAHAHVHVQLELPLEKSVGKTYAPMGSEKLVYFIDDVNMPMLDT